MVTMETIRQRYPHPQSLHTPYPADPYCVGGAVCRVAFRTQATHFPSTTNIAAALRKLNRRLEERAARAYAWAITEANRQEDFETAWQIVDRALSVH